MSTEHRGKSRSPTIWLLIGLILVTFGMRVYRLDGQSLWRDEGLTVVRARQPLEMIFANRNLVQGVSSPDLHPPLYFLMLHGWRLLAGESEFALRFPSLLAIVLAIAMFSAVGRRVWGRETGVWAAILATLSPFCLWYAQEARMYAWVVLESLVLLYTLWPLLHHKQRAGWAEYIKFGLAAAVLTYTYYNGVFLVGFAILACLAVRMEKRAWWRLLIILASVGLIAIPLYPNIRELLAAAGFVAFSRRALWTLLQEATNTFSLGSAGPMADPGWRLVPFVLLALTGALTLDVAPRVRRWRASLIGVGGFLITLVLFYLASWLQANYSNPRHLIILSPAWFLLMGHGLATLRRRLWPVATLVGLAALICSGLALFQTVTDPPIVRDDVRGLAAYIEERARPGDAVLWHNAVMMVTYNYYALDLPYTALPKYGEYEEAGTLQALAQWAEPHERIWFISYPPPFFFDKTLVPGWLDDRMIRMEMVNFPASWTTLWLKLYRPPHLLTTLPAGALPADLQQGAYWIKGLAPEPEATTGKGMWLSLFWSMDGEPTGEPQSACVRLLDSKATIWSEGCAALETPQIGTLMEQQAWLPLPVGLAPVPYTVELILGDERQKVGTLDVQRSSPPDFGELSRAELKPLAQYSGGLKLVGVEWVADEFRAGLWAKGNLVWEVASPPGRDLDVTVRLVDWLGQSVAEQVAPLGPPNYPARYWQAGDLVRTMVDIKLPSQLSGWYRVQVSVTETDGEPLPVRGLAPHRWAGLGWVRVAGWPLERELPEDVTHRLDEVYLGSSIRLEGYDVTREDTRLTINLYWRCEQELTENYGVFVHVGRPGEEPLTQASGVPANWTRPIESWRKGEVILDSREISLPPDLDTEGLFILVGMFDLDQPHVRLPLTVAGEVVPDGALLLGPLP
ncbi:MAG: glycosyltransferase family 39 protein [Anaerolineae bacterium]|nr:glycosyltransferase family 39 protein [Anaerolineae bacterium]